MSPFPLAPYVVVRFALQITRSGMYILLTAVSDCCLYVVRVGKLNDSLTICRYTGYLSSGFYLLGQILPHCTPISR